VKCASSSTSLVLCTRQYVAQCKHGQTLLLLLLLLAQ
jgi:hypothetical protein